MKFNLLTKYLFVYAAVALLGFLGVTFISYRIDYAKVYNYYTDALYKQALSISSEYADDYFSEEHLRIVETELRTVAPAQRYTHYVYRHRRQYHSGYSLCTGA